MLISKQLKAVLKDHSFYLIEIIYGELWNPGVFATQIMVNDPDHA
jgi:hypothetical protein